MAPQPSKSVVTESPTTSTGPRTPKGKTASSRNALKHGLASETMLLPSESAQEWEEFRDGMFAEWQPDTPTEQALVGDLAKHQWLKDRAIRLQTEFLEYSRLSDKNVQRFSVLMRYQTTNERAFARAQKQLQELRNNRQPKFVSQNVEPVETPSVSPMPKRRKNKPLAEINAMTDAEIDHEMNEMAIALGLGLPAAKAGS